jgi:hypothetical protein
LFKIWLASQNSFGFFLAFLHAKIICLKMTFHPFLNPFLLRKIFFGQMDKVKAVELLIAVSMAYHCAIRAVDHLSETITAHGHGSTLQHIKLL